MRRHLAAVAVGLGALFSAGTGAAFADTPTQAVQQAAGTGQSASSSATSTQVAPSNSAISVRIGSPGNDGSVGQSNDSLAGAAAGNAASTSQDASQQGSAGGTQAADQLAKTEQSANADATSTQVKPSNSAISVRIGSPGNGGSAQQSNSSAALAAAGNLAHTTQTADQSASGSGSGSSCSSCGGGGGSTQAADQTAKTEQSANADATSKQIAPSNSAISVRIHSPGDDGSVDQSNSSKAGALAGNAAQTTQTATQDPKSSSCGCSGGGSTQAVGQFAKTEQSANADATSEQIKPSNSATSVRIGSPGNDGDVTQSNSSKAGALAGNLARTTQTADQQAGSGSGDGVQAIDQEAATLQDASSDATSEQIHPSNDATSVRIGSPGNGGSVDQSNDSAAFSFAGNLADTTQDASQTQSSSSDGCGCGHGDQVQAVGQFAFTGQSADSSATSKQIGASNSATSVRLPGKDGKDHGSSCGCDSGSGSLDGHDGSFGDDGSVSQNNTSAALSAAGNLASTDQTVNQDQGSGSGSDWSSCGCSHGGAGVQAVGQFAWTGQSANADANSFQLKPSNEVTPVRIGSGGSNGFVYQSNLSLAKALAFNAARTDQSVMQQQ